MRCVKVIDALKIEPDQLDANDPGHSRDIGKVLRSIPGDKFILAAWLGAGQDDIFEARH
jgi:hypothetical protein